MKNTISIIILGFVISFGLIIAMIMADSFGLETSYADAIHMKEIITYGCGIGLMWIILKEGNNQKRKRRKSE